MIDSSNMKPNAQYIFFDESGKPEIYSSKGTNLVLNGKATKFLVLSAIRSNDQLTLQQKVTEFRLSLLKDSSLLSIFSTAYGLDSFHAQTDYPQVKEKFLAFITTLDVRIDVLIVEKLKCHVPLQQNPGKLYGVMAGQLLRNLIHQVPNTEIIFSRKDSKLQLRNGLVTEVESSRLEYVRTHPKLKSNITLNYQHNPHYTHGGLQIADYIAHVIYQVCENGKRNYYEIIKDKIGAIHDICNRKFYTKNSGTRYL